MAAEIDDAADLLCHHSGGWVRMELDMALTRMLPEIIAFFNHHPGDKTDPIFKIGDHRRPWLEEDLVRADQKDPVAEECALLRRTREGQGLADHREILELLLRPVREDRSEQQIGKEGYSDWPRPAVHRLVQLMAGQQSKTS